MQVTAPHGSFKEIGMNGTVRGRTLWCFLALALVALPEAMALPLSPLRWVTNLDERCYLPLPPAPTAGVAVNLTFLDPVLVHMGLQAGTVTLGTLAKLCVPVEKNNTPPPPDTLPYVSYLDWSCFNISGPSLGISLNLTQLNPIISVLFGPNVTVNVGVPQQLCVPVYKNNVVPTPDVQHLVQYMDVECFAVTSSQQIAGRPITLSHLNPLFTGRSPETLTFPVPGPTQLCVPVAKDTEMAPTDVLPYVQYSDVLCYPLLGVSLDSILTLNQLDQVLINKGLKAETISAGRAFQLCVPVEKNGDVPPGKP